MTLSVIAAHCAFDQVPFVVPLVPRDVLLVTATVIDQQPELALLKHFADVGDMRLAERPDSCEVLSRFLGPTGARNVGLH